MEKLININKLYNILKDIIENRDDVEIIRDIIIQLHFSIQEIKLIKTTSEKIDFDALEKVAMYLLSVLTNVTSTQMQEYIKGFYTDGLNIASLIFELFSEIKEVNAYQKHNYLFYCSVCYSLANKEASSAVIGKKMLLNLLNNNLFNKSDIVKNCWISICNTLSREFKVLYKDKDLAKIAEQTDYRNHWEHLNSTLFMNASCFINGFSSDKIFESFNIIKSYLLEKDYVKGLFVVSLLFDVLRKMHSNSIWNVLSKQGFSEQYLLILSKYDSKNVYEVWKSQLEALKFNENGINYLSDEVNRALISMPTSAGKSFIAELAIVKSLEQDRDQKCIYVTPSRALCTEIENNLFYRFRRLGFNVSSIQDTDENDYENELLDNVHVLVVTPEKLDLLIRRNKDFKNKIKLVVFDEFHKISDNNRGWLLETLIAWFLINQNQFSYKLILMSAIVSNTELLNLWIGNDKIKPLTSEWSPNRRIYSVVNIQRSDTIWSDVRENVKLVKTPYKLTYKYQDRIKEIKNIFEDCTQIKSNKNGSKKDYNNSDTKFDRCYKLIKYLNDDKILIYFFTKGDLDSFIQYSHKYLDVKDSGTLKKLKLFLSQRLGDEHPLVKNIMNGVAYHHGDLPVEVRKEVEKSYRAGDIDILACTTTLSDGINLPIKNFILGSFTTYGSEFRLSIADFKNIVGRAGRAYIDTEGRIFLILHPEYSEGDNKAYFNRLVNCEEEKTNVLSPMLENFDSVNSILSELEEVIEISLQDADRSILDYIDRLQVFSFSLYEEFRINNSLEEINEFCDIFQNLLFIYQTSEDHGKIQSFNNICRRYYNEASSLREETIIKINMTGLSFRSNRILKEISEEIARNDDFNNLSIERIITREIFEEIIKIKEIIPKVYKYRRGRTSRQYTIDHYKVFIDWINGRNFVQLRDSLFIEDGDISNRTKTCVNYFNDMFLYKLPWAFSSLYVFVKDSTVFSEIIIQNLPVIVKYGVKNLEAIKLCTLGLESRELANKLADLYETDASEDSIDKWIIEKNFYYFESNISDIDEISIRQISKVRTKLRKRTYQLRDTGSIRCEVLGLPFYQYRTLHTMRRIRGTTEIRLIQEPENLYDEFAVRVETYDGDKIGYIRSTYAEEIYDFIEGNHSLNVSVVSFTIGELWIDVIVKP